MIYLFSDIRFLVYDEFEVWNNDKLDTFCHHSRISDRVDESMTEISLNKTIIGLILLIFFK